MSVPRVALLIRALVVERVEKYFISLSNLFYKPRHSTLITALNDNKAVFPASDGHAGSIPTGTYKYELNLDRKMR